jgi:predicted nucleic acid-binding protein
MTNHFIDSNIILYLFDFDLQKSMITNQIVASKPKINSQVLVEVINVCRRKFGFKKDECLNLCNDLIKTCEIVSIGEKTIESVSQLVEKYDFQIFDGIIVASALESGCDLLYSEDMQHGLLVEGRLRIRNPFLS